MFAQPDRTFLDQPFVALAALRHGDMALFGAGQGTPYPDRAEVSYALATGSAAAPAAIRAAANQSSGDIDHWDFDLDGPLLPAGRRIVDLGDLAEPADAAAARAGIAAATSGILRAGAVPVLLGGDDSVPIPFLQAFGEGQGPVDVLQVDAHIDWRDSLGGERLGYSSTMRRASELPFVRSITQVGMRGVGSARAAEVAAARGWGARLITVEAARAMGPQALADALPAGGRLVVQVDLDAFDTAVCPAVNAPTPGGFGFAELAGLVRAAVAARGLAGFSVVELVPARDPWGLSATVAARLICNVLGTAARRQG